MPPIYLQILRKLTANPTSKILWIFPEKTLSFTYKQKKEGLIAGD